MNRNLLSYRSGGAPDNLDVLLRTFFQAELPDPWPSLKAPATTLPEPVPAGKPRWSAVRSRLALAASVGVLMVGSWSLSVKLPDFNGVGAELSPTNSGGIANLPRFPKPVKGPATDGQPVKAPSGNPGK